MRSGELTDILEELFPVSLAVEGDVTGPQIIPEDHAVSSLVLAYELTDVILDELSGTPDNYVVVFHPLIYRPTTTISHADRVGRALFHLLRTGTSLFITHTRLDAHPQGTNTQLARMLGATGSVPLIPNESGPADSGMGQIAEFGDGIDFSELVNRIGTVTGARGIRTTETEGNPVLHRVAIVAGSGMSFYPAAANAEVDAMVTADVRYHDFHASKDLLPIIDPGHAESEVGVLPATERILRDRLGRIPDLEIRVISTGTNPVSYPFRM